MADGGPIDSGQDAPMNPADGAPADGAPVDSSVDAAVQVLALAVTDERGTVGIAGHVPCSADGSGECLLTVPRGLSQVITATPFECNTLDSWGGDCFGQGSTCTLLMDQDRIAAASFRPRKLVVTIAGPGDVVSSDGTSISCGPLCEHEYDSCFPVTLQEQPHPGNVFTGWSGDCSGDCKCAPFVTKDLSVTAGFEASHVTRSGPTGLPPNFSYPRSAVWAADGGYYLSGYFTGTGVVAQTLLAAQGYDAYIVRYDALGQAIWATALGGALDDFPRDIALGPGGELAVVGHAETVSLDREARITVYSATGDLLWERQFNNGDTRFHYVAWGDDASILVSGDFQGAVHHDGQSLTGTGFRDGLLVKVAANDGGLLWMRAGGGPNTDQGGPVRADGDDVYWSVAVYGDADIGCGALGPEEGSYDVGLARYTSGGDCVWARRFGQALDDMPTDMVVTGATVALSVYRYTPGPGPTRVGEIRAFTTVGDQVFQTLVAGEPWALGVAPSVGFVAGGYLTEDASFDGAPVCSRGGDNFLLVSIALDGTPRWARRAGSGPTGIWALDVDGTGRVLAAGELSGSLDLGNGAFTGGGPGFTVEYEPF